MRDLRPVLLMTRPREASARFVAALPEAVRQGLEVVIAPLMGIEALVQGLDFGAARGLIFSSGNGVAVAAGASADRRLPCFCVGEATAAAARAEGWQAEAAGRDADGLVERLEVLRPEEPLLHLSGEHVRGDIAGRLTRAGLAVEARAIYRQPLLPLGEEAREVLAGPRPVIVPLFSPRSARHFAAVAETGHVHAIAMSAAVAEALDARRFASVVTAAQPDAVSMVQAVAEAPARISRVEGGSPGR